MNVRIVVNILWWRFVSYNSQGVAPLMKVGVSVKSTVGWMCEGEKVRSRNEVSAREREIRDDGERL